MESQPQVQEQLRLALKHLAQAIDISIAQVRRRTSQLTLISLFTRSANCSVTRQVS